MAIDAPAIARARTRRAYELGRLRLGLWAALPVIPMAALSLLVCRRPQLTLAAGLALFALAVGLGMRGQVYGRALRPGLWAGSVPLILPAVLRTGGHACIGGACWSLCMIGCIGGGVLAGVAIGLTSAAQEKDRGAFLLVAIVVACLAGMLGCAMAGVSGIAGMAIAIAAAPLPVVVAVRARAPL
jgi:hypothetical protein